jgi:hypothetical protein
MLKPLAVGVGVGTAIGLAARGFRLAATLVRERAANLGAVRDERRPSKLVPAGEPRPTELADLSKADLYQQAQEAGIPGRSRMSKAELIAALRSARG